MLASEIKVASVHFCPLPPNSRVDYFICNSLPPPLPMSIKDMWQEIQEYVPKTVETTAVEILTPQVKQQIQEKKISYLRWKMYF